MSHLVFVYGSLKKGFGNNYHLQENAEYLGDFVTEPIFTMYSLGGFPAIREKGRTPITGEVYRVGSLSSLDRLEGHPTFYKRQEISTPYGKAWVYILTYEPMTSKVIEIGIW